jgi:hypothetical protein
VPRLAEEAQAWEASGVEEQGWCNRWSWMRSDTRPTPKLAAGTLLRPPGASEKLHHHNPAPADFSWRVEARVITHSLRPVALPARVYQGPWILLFR